MKPDDYCANLVSAPGSNLYYSLMFLPAPTRAGANAVYALSQEIANVAEECSDPGVAHVKFDWWREELLRMYMGTPRHPVTQALAPAINQHKFDHETLLAMIDATEAAFDRARFENLDALLTHCRHTGAAPLLLITTLFGYRDSTTLRFAETLGIALRLADVLIHVGRDIRRNRLFLPLEDIRRAGVSESDLLACRHTPEFESLMSHQVERTLRLLDEADATLPSIDRVDHIPSVVMAALMRAQLDELRRDGYHALERRVALTPLRKLWISFKTRAAENRRARRAA